MLRGISLSELAAEVERQSAIKRDFVAPGSALSVVAESNGNLSLDIAKTGTFGLGPVFHEQVAARTAIPRIYYDRMRMSAPDLLARNVNHWLHAEPEEKRLVRVLGDRARSLLSDRYRSLDNDDALRGVLPVLSEHGVEVLSSEITERRLYLQVVSPRRTFEVKVGVPVRYGLLIENSEVGLGTLSVAELIETLACKNGMVLSRIVRKTHVGRRIESGVEAEEFFSDATRKADDRAFFLKLRDTVAGLLGEARIAMRMDMLRDSTQRKIEGDPVAVVEVVQRKLDLTDGERGDVLRHLIEGGDLSAWGLANAITACAHDAKDYDRSVELERAGGRVIELPRSEWSEVSKAA